MRGPFFRNSKSSQASSQSESISNDCDNLGVELLPTTPPPTDAASAEPPTTGQTTNPRPDDSEI